MSLLDFTERSAPVLRESPRRVVRVPHSDRTAGVVGLLESGERAFVSPRTRERHFFRKFDGYAVSTSVLCKLVTMGIERVLIQETDTGTVYEYDMFDFYHEGIPWEFEDGDEQEVVPVSASLFEWPDHADALL